MSYLLSSFHKFFNNIYLVRATVSHLSLTSEAFYNKMSNWLGKNKSLIEEAKAQVCIIMVVLLIFRIATQFEYLYFRNCCALKISGQEKNAS